MQSINGFQLDRIHFHHHGMKFAECFATDSPLNIIIMLKQPVKFLGIASILFLCGIAQGVPVEFTANLSGPAEAPPNASPGTGFADLFYDPITHLLQVSVTFSGLTGTTTAAHIHAATSVPFAGTAGVATTTPTFTGFPPGVTSGSYFNILDLTLASSYNPSYVSANGGTTTTAEAALVAAMMQGKSYFNIHTTAFGGGEIRGFLAAVPDSAATGTLLILALASMVVFTWLQRCDGKSASKQCCLVKIAPEVKRTARNSTPSLRE